MTCESKPAASSSAASSPSGVLTSVSPTVEPWPLGLTINGNPSRCAATCADAGAMSHVGRRHAGREEQPLRDVLVPTERAAELAAARVRDAGEIEQRLHRAVLAAAAVHGEKHEIHVGEIRRRNDGRQARHRLLVGRPADRCLPANKRCSSAALRRPRPES